MPMALDERTAQAQLTPEERRALLRAFADRMLRKITAMDDPEDMPGVERAVRVAAVIERVYSRCDRAERQRHIEAPALFKAEAECASHKSEAIRARVSLANTLKWGEERRLALGAWWDAAQSAPHTPTSASQNPATPAEPPAETPISSSPVWTSDRVAENPVCGSPKPQTPISNALNSYTSGHPTPAPNLAKTDLAIQERRIRSTQTSGP